MPTFVNSATAERAQCVLVCVVVAALGAIVGAAITALALAPTEAELLQAGPAVTPPAAGVTPLPAPAVAPPRGPGTEQWLIKAYCHCRICCGRWADTPMDTRTTAAGVPLADLIEQGVGFVAANTDLLPFHTLVAIPGYHEGRPVPVLDRIGGGDQRRLEVFFADHQTALEWGRQDLDIQIARPSR